MSRGRITVLLNAHASGEEGALDALFPIVYDELRRLAELRMRRERRDHTLSATALVHEAYLKLVDLDGIDWESSQHFFAIASRVMRNVLVDYAAKRNTLKRGGGKAHAQIRRNDAVAEPNLTDVIAVHDALTRLEAMDERQVRVVECRVFGGLTVAETARALDVSPATVGRDWKMARAWLNRELKA